MAGDMHREAEPFDRVVISVDGKPSHGARFDCACGHSETLMANTTPKLAALPAPDLSLRRRILRELDDHYIDARSGYAEGHSDSTIAAALNCSVDAVRRLREENFGPLAENPMIDELRREQARIGEFVAKAKAEIDAAATTAMERADAATKELDRKAADLAKKITEAMAALRRKPN